MNDFEATLLALNKESDEIQKKEIVLQQEARLFQEKFFGFLKQHGLSENFTLPNLAVLAVRKARDLITVK